MSGTDDGRGPAWRRVGTLAACILIVATLPATAVRLVAPASPSPQEAQLDVLIVGGRVFDGTGNPWFIADVGVAGDRIVAVGDRRPRSNRGTGLH